MTERRLFPEGTIPEYSTPEWYVTREHAPHLEQPLHRPRLEVAARYVVELVAQFGYASVVDIGAGDGGLLTLVERAPELEHRRPITHGYDLQPSNVVAAAARGINVVLEDAIDAVIGDDIGFATDVALADVVVCTEVLEHLVDPHGFLAALHDRGEVKALVCSSPWNETEGHAYEFHLWAWDELGYRELLTGAGWAVDTHTTTGMFQVVAALR